MQRWHVNRLIRDQALAVQTTWWGGVRGRGGEGVRGGVRGGVRE